MPAIQKRTFSLPEEQASYIESLVKSGSYASESEVVSAGIEALQDRDAEMEDWLRKEVLPVVEAMEADPSRGIPLEEVFEKIEAHHAQRMRDGSR